MIYHFKVRYGFGQSEYVSITDGPDLERAIYAWTEQIPVALGGRIIQGKHIIAIEPHYHKYTGWYETYVPKSPDDFKQIERDCPSFNGVIEQYQRHVHTLIAERRTEMIGQGTVVLQIAATKPQPEHGG